jgi:hypothetical protein
MSLLDLALGVVGALNSNVSVTLYTYAGFTQSPGGPRLPLYTVSTVSAQVQELSTYQLKHMDELNVGGLLHNIWADTTLHSVDRVQGLGGDIIGMADGTWWLVVHVKEQFTDGWCAAVMQKQTKGPTS